ncbi:MAG: aspartate aminotransferase family protein [Bacteroidetes bacterium]|nr:MAG: aspartate aminotransferase family protein [Bacteroidota bacterium]
MDLFDDFNIRAKKYFADIQKNPVYPSPSSVGALQQLNVPLQEESLQADEVLNMLDAIGSPATVKSTGGRYFGFVTGGSLPAAMFAKLLATVWDQNTALPVMSPIAATLEEIAANWLLSVLGLPADAGVGFVTGATMANFTALASARHQLLMNEGWDVEAKGLFHAPEITVIVGDEVHVSLLKALTLVGFGRERIIRVPADDEGRIIVDKIPGTDAPTIICTQAGNVNTGNSDDINAICEQVKNKNTWVHVDAAFALWAAASPRYKYLLQGIEKADSWGADAHKWLNVPYDCGLVFVKNKEALVKAMSSAASYLPTSGMREPFQYVPEMSREARGVAVWAALKSLGRKGLAELIERHCSYAQQFAEQLRKAGYAILNKVVLNQVLVGFGDADTTQRVIKRVQEDGTCWCGGTVWQGKTAMRISVSSWAHTDEDIQQSIAAIIAAAEKECA